MRIGIDYRPAMQAPVGIGRYVAGLTGALAADPEVDLRLYGIFRKGNRPAVRRAPAGAALVGWPVPTRVMGQLARFRVLETETVLGGCDLFHHTNFVLAPARARTPQVMTVHDLAFLHDEAYHTPRATRALRDVMARAVDRCAAFLAPSEATARDCRERLGIDRVTVTPLGVDARCFAPARPESRAPYLLAVGTLEPRKNYARLIAAFAQARLDLDLCIAGADGWLCADVKRAAALHPRVHLLGRVSDERLRALVAGARAVCYVSLLEGFGLPVLEALAAGRPVLTSDRAPLRDVAADAALLVDPADEAAIADALRRVATDDALRATLKARGPERARRFTWSQCAAATRAVYAEVLAP